MLAEELLDVRLNSVFKAPKRVFPTVSLSLVSMGALPPYPGRSGTNSGASFGSRGIRWRHLFLDEWMIRPGDGGEDVTRMLIEDIHESELEPDASLRLHLEFDCSKLLVLYLPRFSISRGY